MVWRMSSEATARTSETIQGCAPVDIMVAEDYFVQLNRERDKTSHFSGLSVTSQSL